MNASEYDTKHLKVLDGIRAMAILIIVWFHFWQQSWLSVTIGSFSFDFLYRYGFLFVDMMILISSFCLFIPYARSKVYKEKIPNTKEFYIKRLARILPSYYLSMIIALIFVIVLKKINFNFFFIKDTLMNIFFVQNWSSDVIRETIYIGALWTVAIEMQYYLIYPFIAKKFIKKPIVTYSIMMIIGIICLYVITQKFYDSHSSIYVNHFLTFIPIYANGMMASYFYIKYTKNRKRTYVRGLLCTAISIIMIIIYAYLCKSIGTSNVQEWQLSHRLILSFVFTVFIISTLLASKIYQKISNNRFMKFICIISFNLYIYHQFIAVKLKEFRIPFYSGDTPPNMLGNRSWELKYTIICIIISLLVATIITYLV